MSGNGSSYAQGRNTQEKVVHSIYDLGDRHIVIQEPPLPKLLFLPPGAYRLAYDEKTDQISFMNVASSFTVPEKIFGKKYTAYANTVWKEYRTQPIAMGLLMTGVKGSGKSMLAEMLGNKMIISLRPCIMIDKKFSIDVIIRAMRIVGPCMMYFDEFSKHYEREDQDRLLPLFSDTSVKETLFVVCDNETNRLSEFILDRPGRFLYHIRFSGIDRELCDEICSQYNLIPEALEHIHAYIVENKISVDVMRVLANKASTAKTYADYLMVFDILNIPKPTFKELIVNITFPTHMSPEDVELAKKEIKVVKKTPDSVTISRGEDRIELRIHRWDCENRLGNLQCKLDHNNTSKIQPAPGADLEPNFIYLPKVKATPEIGKL